MDEWDGESWLCVLTGPSLHALLTALKALPRRMYVAPYFWIVDTEGLLRLRAAGLQVGEGALNPVLAALAHQISRSIARYWLLADLSSTLPIYTPNPN